MSNQEQNLEESPVQETQEQYGTFRLKQNSVTEEAYFEVPSQQLGVVKRGENILLEKRHTLATGELTYTLPRIHSVDKPGSSSSISIFSKYISQHDVLVNADRVEIDAYTVLHEINPTQFWREVQLGNIEDARVISAMFNSITSNMPVLPFEDISALHQRYYKMVSSVLSETYGVEALGEVVGVDIDKDPWMTTSVTPHGAHFYNNSRPEVLVIASEDSIYDEEGMVNWDAKIQVNMEMLPAQLGVGIVLPGGSEETFETDKPFIIDRSTGEIDHSMKSNITNLIKITGNNSVVGSAAMEVAQETDLGLPSLDKSNIYTLGGVYAGPDTTNAYSKFVVIDSVPRNEELGRDSADEVARVSNDTYSLSELIVLIQTGVITDTRLISMISKLVLTKPTKISMEVLEG